MSECEHGRLARKCDLCDLNAANVALRNVEGALVDSGVVVPADEARYGQAVREIIAERDRIVARVAGLVRENERMWEIGQTRNDCIEDIRREAFREAAEIRTEFGPRTGDMLGGAEPTWVNAQESMSAAIRARAEEPRNANS